MSSNPKKAKPTTTTTTKTKTSGVCVKTFRIGAIGATVWLRTGTAGLEYLTYTLSRAWKYENSEKWNYSSDFFAGNGEALIGAISQAEAFIEDHKDDPRAAVAAKQMPTTNGLDALPVGADLAA